MAAGVTRMAEKSSVTGFHTTRPHRTMFIFSDTILSAPQSLSMFHKMKFAFPFLLFPVAVAGSQYNLVAC